MRRSTTAVILVVAAVGLPLAVADPLPRDPFTMALPSRDTKPPEGIAAKAEAHSVVEQQGTAAHSIPIEVPDGRLGMQPSLSLDYSSGGALRGGIAVGWTLDTPVIERDPAFTDTTKYRTSLGGGWQRLIPNTQDPGTGNRYRAEVDSTFTRYRFDGGSNSWTASGSDGVLRTFTQYEPMRWRLTTETDPFGNTVTYSYQYSSQGGFVEYALASVQYTSNANAGIPAHAKVDLIWDGIRTCGGIAVGAATDYHFSQKRASGMRKLLRIETSVKDGAGGAWRLARRYSLSYDGLEEDCSMSALRYLTQIDVTAYTQQGAATSAPPIAFGYGAKHPAFASTMTLPSLGFGDQGRKLGPTSTLLDMDGDGLVDRVDMKTGQHCRLEWKKGIGPGQFSTTVNAQELPTARWREGDLPRSDEYCTLSGQKVVRSFSFDSLGCTYWDVTVSYNLVDIDGDGRIDVLTSMNEPHLGDAGGDFALWSGIVFQDDGDQNGGCPIGHTPVPDGSGDCTGPECPFGKHRDPWGACVSDDCPAGTCEDPDPGAQICAIDPSYPEMAPNGVDYVWRVQRQLPGGAIAAMNTPDFWTFNTPRTLTPNGSEATLDGFGRPSLPRLTDIDGDGYVDLIAMYQYSVSYGDGHVDAMPGQCQTNGFCSVYVWPGRNYAAQGSVKTFGPVQYWNQTAYSNSGNTLTEQYISGTDWMTSSIAIAFRDMNADGLPDVVAQSSSGQLSVAYNMAGALYQGAFHSGAFSAPVSFGFVSPAEQNRTEVGWEWRSQYLNSGQRASMKRLVDLDSDGFVDQVSLTPGSSIIYPSTQRKVRRLFGSGNAAPAETDLGSEYEAVEGLVTAVNGGWRRMSDFTDLTGDGQPDLVTWEVDGSATLRTDHGAVTSPRLLETINNGRGGVTRFEYARSNDPNVVTLGIQPLSPRFVVARVITSPGFGQPDMKTTYHYATPAYGLNSPSDPDAPGFLGFQTITVDSSGQIGDDGKRVVKTFDYAAVGSDWRGQLKKEVTYIKQDGAHYAATIAAYSYGSGAIANTTATTTFVTSTTQRTCYAYLPDWLCEYMTVNTKTTTDTWIPKYLSGSYPSLYVNSETVTSDGVTVPRYHRMWYLPLNGPTDYRVFTTSEERGMVSGGNYLQWAFTTTLFDANQKYLPVETRVYRDLYNYSATRRGFDVQTGVQTSLTKPNQVAGTHYGSEAYAYDPYKLFIVSRYDEGNRGYQETFDLATGAVLTRTGPNFRNLPPPGCNYWCFNIVYEREEWTIDGFGRVLQHRDSLDANDGSGGYVLRPVEWFTYDEVSQPNRKITSRLRDPATYEAVIDEQQYDGSGRVLKTIARRQLAGQCDPETRYTYDAGGELQRIETPDPRTDSCATVATTYARDGLGRVTTMTRPDGSSEIVSYDGLATTSQEVSAEGTGAKTSAVTNAYGELVEVDELDNPTAGAIAYTRYGYDPLGRMQTITDADNNVTTLGYDFRGLRTSVTRGGRTWTYAYDATGNLVSQTEPIPSGGSAADYTSKTFYTDVNNPYLYQPAKRGMSDARRAELGIGDVQLWYDIWGTCCGKPYSFTTPFGTTTFEYDARGNVAKETRTVNLAGTSTAQWVQRTYDPLGNQLGEKWDDGTEWRYEHDHRGAVESVQWRDPAIGLFVELAGYERSAAGQPRHRTSAYEQQRDWDYDVMGRVIYDHVWNAGNEDNLHERQYGYDGFGELNMIAGITGNESIDATYLYDRRHRLTHAEGPLGYEATFQYSGAGNVRRAEVSGALDAPGRYVDYAYGATDPQAVDWLTDVNTGSTVAAYIYDRAGNMTQRYTPQGSFTFAWGADGFLREAAGPNGTERYFFGPNADRWASVGPDGIKLWFGASETHLTPSGAVAHRYHHIAAGEPIARVIDSTQLELQYADALQNLAVTADRQGNLKSSFVYGAFGETLSAYDPSDDHRRRFNGKEHDEVSGLRHYGYRSYDPYTLRWVSGDPLYRTRPDAAWTEPQRANLYAFSLNNTNRSYDPDGRDAYVYVPGRVPVHVPDNNVVIPKGNEAGVVFTDTVNVTLPTPAAGPQVFGVPLGRGESKVTVSVKVRVEYHVSEEGVVTYEGGDFTQDDGRQGVSTVTVTPPPRDANGVVSPGEQTYSVGVKVGQTVIDVNPSTQIGAGTNGPSQTFTVGTTKSSAPGPAAERMVRVKIGVYDPKKIVVPPPPKPEPKKQTACAPDKCP